MGTKSTISVLFKSPVQKNKWNSYLNRINHRIELELDHTNRPLNDLLSVLKRSIKFQLMFNFGINKYIEFSWRIVLNVLLSKSFELYTLSNSMFILWTLYTPNVWTLFDKNRRIGDCHRHMEVILQYVVTNM